MNLDRYGSFVFRLADSFFIVGLIYLLIALSFYIRNVGFFKLFAYGRYRKRHLKAESSRDKEENKEDKKQVDSSDKPMELHEFCQEHYGEKWSSKHLLIYAIPLLILSFIFSYLA